MTHNTEEPDKGEKVASNASRNTIEQPTISNNQKSSLTPPNNPNKTNHFPPEDKGKTPKTQNNQKNRQKQPQQKQNQDNNTNTKQQQQPKGPKVQKPRSLANKESFLRLSYLHQLTQLLTTHTGIDLSPLQQTYGRQLNLTSLRSQTKLDPNVKRAYCKKCHSTFIPGISMKMELINEGTKGECLLWKCLNMGCEGVRRFPVGREVIKNPKGDGTDCEKKDDDDEKENHRFVLFTERPEHDVEVV